MVIAEKGLHFNHSRQQRGLFCSLFPRGMEPTKENARRAAGDGLSLRGLSPQVMEPKPLAGFVRQTNMLYKMYLENTADTLNAVRELNPLSKTAELVAVTAIHEENKQKHWAAYLDGLATAFERGLETIDK